MSNSEEKHVSRRSLVNAMLDVSEKAEKIKAQYSRQVDYDDLFDAWTGKKELPGGILLITPPYKAGRMYELYEQSGVLNACVEAYVANIDGYGYNIVSGESDDSDTQLENDKTYKEVKSFS